MKQRFLPALLFTLATIGLTASLSAADPPPGGGRRPNIVIIVADDLGYADIGVQGNKDVPTPNIDSLAHSGVRFTSGYVSGPYCSPTRAGLLTGRYQTRFGHEFNPGGGTNNVNFGLSLKEVTIADRLIQAGYKTGLVGKWHLGNEPKFNPLNRGFQEYFGFLGGAHSYTNLSPQGGNPIQRGFEAVVEKEYLTDAFTREALAFIDRHKQEPFFLLLTYNAVHSPLDIHPKYFERFSSISDPKRRQFATLLAALDDGVGAVREKLRSSGLEEDTLVVFFSDNGGPTPGNTSRNAPLRGYKATTWEGGIRVPFIISWKGNLPAGKVEDRPIIQLDLHPTALAAAGVEAKPEWKLDGVNLLPYLTGAKSERPHETLYWRFGQQIALRKGDWKLVKGASLGERRGLVRDGTASTEGAELYNLAKDIGEQTNLADKEPEKAKELAAAWNAWNAELSEPAWRPGARGGGRGNAGRATLTSNTTETGPWKAGDVLSAADSPNIAGRGFVLRAEIESSVKEGVVLAQGGAANGYTLFVQDGKLSFGIRATRSLTVVTAKDRLGEGTAKVEARLEADGKITLKVAGKQVAEGRAPGLIQKRPARGLTVGRDEGSVGDYSSPNPFNGRISNVRLNLL